MASSSSPSPPNQQELRVYQWPNDERECKRTRRSAPKSRSGCSTCKARRIKCDETKPICVNCSRTKRVCKGYPSTENSKTHTQANTLIPIEPKRNSTSIPSSSQQLSRDLNRLRSQSPSPTSSTILLNSLLPPSEHHSLTHFLTTTSPSLAGHLLSSPFAGPLLPRLAVFSPSIHHALIALSSLHESYLLSPEDFDTTHGENNVFAISQYNRAILELKKEIEKKVIEGEEPDYHVLIITCFLFVCLEFMRGMMGRGLVHLKGGLELLALHRKSLRGMTLSSEQSRTTEQGQTDSSITQAFSRLSLQVSTLGQPIPKLDLTHHTYFSTNVPFTSISAAQDQLTSIVSLAHNTPFFWTPQPDSPGVIYQGLAKEKLYKLVLRLQDWKTNMEEFSKKNWKVWGKRERVAVWTLRIENYMALIWHWCGLSDSEAAFDNHIPYFEAIISLSTLVIDAQEDTGKSRKNTQGFSFEVGILFALLSTAIKCRDPVIRRESVRLLTLVEPQREGLWHAGLLKVIAERVIEIEEKPARERGGVKREMGTWPRELERVRVAYFLPLEEMRMSGEGGTQDVRFFMVGDGVGWGEVLEYRKGG